MMAGPMLRNSLLAMTATAASLVAATRVEGIEGTMLGDLVVADVPGSAENATTGTVIIAARRRTTR